MSVIAEKGFKMPKQVESILDLLSKLLVPLLVAAIIGAVNLMRDFSEFTASLTRIETQVTSLAKIVNGNDDKLIVLKQRVDSIESDTKEEKLEQKKIKEEQILRTNKFHSHDENGKVLR